MDKNIPQVSPETPIFLIYSREHNAWWKLGRCGYTRDPREAGLYCWADAYEIVSEANRDARPEDFPAEFFYPAPPEALLLVSHLTGDPPPEFILVTTDPQS